MHHIVAVGSEKARASVATLQAYGIDLDSPANGVFLPYRKNELVTTEAMHCGGHLDSYHKTVETKLSAIIDVADEYCLPFATVQTMLCDVLHNIRKELLTGDLRIHN